MSELMNMSSIIEGEKEIILQSFKNEAENFMNNLPYRKAPYKGRNWGNAWHSLCSYHGKLKPAIAYHLIQQFTQKGQSVLDPMSGVGTIPFEASLQGRVGIGNDLSELAYTVTRAKLEPPEKPDVNDTLEELENFIEAFKKSYKENEVPYSDFGLNGKLPDYFHPNTYSEILVAREFFINRMNNLSSAETFILTCLLHVLHGNRPYALSRRSHPLTPYAPQGEFVYKNVVEKIRNKVELSFKKQSVEGFVLGKAIYGDLFDLDEKLSDIDNIITSPPFVGSIRFYSSNWMRLWFSGWEPIDFKKADERFLEGKQKKNLEIYNLFFEKCSRVLKDNGKLILHLGKSHKCDMGVELAKLASPLFDVVHLGTENVQELEKHGISDKGSTTDHQFLFLMKK